MTVTVYSTLGLGTLYDAHMNFLPYFPRAFAVAVNARRGNVYYITVSCKTIRGRVHHLKMTVMVDGPDLWPCDTIAGTKQWYPIKTVNVNIWAGMLLKKVGSADPVKRAGRQYESMSAVIKSVHANQSRHKRKIRSAWFC